MTTLREAYTASVSELQRRVRQFKYRQAPVGALYRASQTQIRRVVDGEILEKTGLARFNAEAKRIIDAAVNAANRLETASQEASWSSLWSAAYLQLRSMLPARENRKAFSSELSRVYGLAKQQVRDGRMNIEDAQRMFVSAGKDVLDAVKNLDHTPPAPLAPVGQQPAVAVTFARPEMRGMKPFSMFKDGDYLVSELGILGIKLDSRRVKFFHNAGPGICNLVSPDKNYIMPTSVEVTVTK